MLKLQRKVPSEWLPRAPTLAQPNPQLTTPMNDMATYLRDQRPTVPYPETTASPGILAPASGRQACLK